MDRLRRLGKSKSSALNHQGDNHVHEEKSKSKLPSSSLVARLMRFDGLKSQKPIYRQHKSFVEHTLSETRPVALQGDACLFDGESHKKRLTEHLECKDIFEDKGSKSGSNKDAILELLKKPNPLFLKHLQGVQESSSSSLCSHLPIPKQSDPENFESKDQNVERNSFKKHNIGSKKTHEDGILNQSFTLASTPNHPEPSKFAGEEIEGTDKGTSRIVILKPNYAMEHEARNSSSSHDPSRVNISGSRKYRGHMNQRTKDEDFVETIDFVNGVEVSASRVSKAKFVAKKVVRELRETTGTMNDSEAKESAKRFNKEVHEVFSRLRTDFPDYVQEIPGTGGLFDFSRIDSASESEVMKMTSYDSAESFISRQAKKRLLERWRRAQRNEHARAGGKGSTLGEMLCISEEKLKNLDAAKRDSPLGISSADGWKDKYSKIKPRSRSLPPPPGTRNEKLYAEREYRIDDKLLMSKEIRHRSQSDIIHGNFTETSRSSKSKSQSRHRRASNSNALMENHSSCNEIGTMKKSFPEENPVVSPISTVTSTISTGASITTEYLTAPSASSDACYPDIYRSMIKRRDSSPGGQEPSNPKLGSEAESSGRLKEADSSPISVPEVPSREESSLGLECFKQVTADLHDLRKQLSLLSRESKTKFDVPMHIKTDFFGEELSLAVDANEIVVSECWVSSYIADVLIECGLYDMDTDIFMQSFKSPNLPLGPWVFDNLEEKYCDVTSAPKYERMLLFDRIRSAVLEISQSCMNLCPWPWVKPGTAEFGLKWPKRKLRNELHKLLEIQDAEVMERMSGKATDKVEDWSDLRNSVEMIGIMIGRSLTNDLLMELVVELQLDL